MNTCDSLISHPSRGEQKLRNY